MTSRGDFIHLRVHSAYSLLEGAIKIELLVKTCQALRMPAVAVTDTNNLFGAMEFSQQAASAGVQPITGCQIRLQTTTPEPDSPAIADQLVLLVQNQTGYQNLLDLISHAYLESEAVHDPVITMDQLAQKNAGLIALTGGVHGPVGRALLQDQKQTAADMVVRLKNIFGDRLYMEIQRHNMPEENKTESGFIDLAYEHHVPLVATNEVFFLSPDMYQAHDALLCVADGVVIAQSNRRRVTPEHYFKTADQMKELFKDLPEAILNTNVIARRCGFMPPKRDPILPPFASASGRNEQEELKEQARVGLQERLAAHVFKPGMDDAAREAAAKPYLDRLDYELNVINQMGFPGYFLIVADFIRWTKNQKIPVGPGRGSGAGSVVAWALTITDLDPLRFNLLFERFLNPERVSMPDFDIDFCQERRDEVIHYVQEKYGKDRVAQIITFGKLQARAVLRDAGRVLEMPYGQVDRICKLVPNNPAAPVTLQEAIDTDRQLQTMRDQEEDVARLLEIGLKLEGLYRHASTHAAGVVIGDRPLHELVPMYRDPRSETPVSQFNMKDVEKAGLVKFDFLGLKTLTVLSHTLDLLKDRNIDIDLLTIPLDDPKTFAMLGKGDTTGVFQLESAGMRDVLRKLKPDRFEDIIAVVALYRPGPMDNIPAYIARKHGTEKPDYLYPSLESILKETYGIMIYQEQVMQIAQTLSGYSLGGADLLRRAMGKKIKEEMDDQRKIFVDGAMKNNVTEQTASGIFDQVAKFAGYGFNKSHAAAYALIAYQTAYLKANYPVEFMAASMTLDLGNTDKLNVFRRELDRLEIDLLSPDINKSYATFAVEDQKIRYAMAALKGVGAQAMHALVAERETKGKFSSLADFAGRLDPKIMNKRQLEALIAAGGFDSLNPNRAQLTASIEQILGFAQIASRERETGQSNMFGAQESATAEIQLPNTPDWGPLEKLSHEFSAVGFYLSAHPLDGYEQKLQRMKITWARDLESENSKITGDIKMAGIMISKRERRSARGNKYAFAQLSDPTGVYEVTLFSETLNAARDLLEKSVPLLLHVNVQREENGMRLTVNGMEDLQQRVQNAPAELVVTLDEEKSVPQLADIVHQNEKQTGNCQLVFLVETTNKMIEIKIPGQYHFDDNTRATIENLPGVKEVLYV